MQRIRFTFKIGLPLLIALLLSPVLPAQYRAAIQGAVQDPSGAAVPGAKLTLTSKETGRVQTATSNEDGTYNFLSLAPGDYSLDVEATGFSKKTFTDVVVAAEQTQAVNVQLDLGQVQQTVTVSAPVAPAIDTETGDIGTTLTSNQLHTLPSFARDPYRLLVLAPGVIGDNAMNNGGGAQLTPGSTGSPGASGAVSSIFATENQVQVNANGLRNATNSFQVDGVEVNSLDWGGTAIITPNEESVKEVRVVANSYDASLGRGSGAQVQVVSQNGTNNLHGSAFFKWDRPGLNAHQGYNGPSGPGANQRVANRFNQFGGSVGGPIVRNHLFAFFSYETVRNDSVNTGTTWVETPQYQQAAAAEAGFIAGKLLSFPGEGASYTKVLPVTCAQANLPAGNCQPAGAGLDVGSLLKSGKGTLDPTFGQAASPFGVGGGLDGIPDIQFVQYANPNRAIEAQYNGRIDYQLKPGDLLAYSIYWVPNDTTFFNGQGARPANLWHSDRLNYSQALLWNHVISPTLINEARFNVSRWYFNELDSNPQEPWGLPLDFLNSMGSAGGSAYGTQGPGIFYKTNYNLRDIATKVFGNQTLKFGLDLYKEQNRQILSGAGRPDFVFRNVWDFANDAPDQEFGDFDPSNGVPTNATGYFNTSIWALFLQDNYKLKPNLTLNLGLRWEYFSPIREKYNHLGYPILGTAPNQLTGLTLGIGGNLYNSQKSNFGPQIGFAWSPNKLPFSPIDTHNRVVVRGGFGIGYTRMEEAVTLSPLANIPFHAFFNFIGASASDILYSAPSDPHQFDNWPANPNAVLAFDPNTHLPTGGAPVTLDGIQRNLQSPTTMRYSLETQYDAGHSWIATLGYQGNASRHFTRQQNLNWEFPGVNPHINNLIFWTNDANGDYNALLTEVEHHSHTTEIDAQYTYSRAMDDGSNDFFMGDYEFNHQALWGPSDYDVTHNFKLWGSWSPKIFSGSNNWMEKVIGGWTASGIWNVHSGFPWTPQYNVQIQGDPNTCSLIYNGSGYCTVRPARYLGGAGANYSNKTFEQRLGNFPGGPTLSFLPPTLSASGIPPFPGVHRNSFRGPRYNAVDFTLGKAFGLPNTRLLGEGANLQLRADFYNLFNQVNLAAIPNQTIATILVPVSGPQTIINPAATFDQAQAGLAGRVIELQARFSF